MDEFEMVPFANKLSIVKGHFSYSNQLNDIGDSVSETTEFLNVERETDNFVDPMFCIIARTPSGNTAGHLMKEHSKIISPLINSFGNDGSVGLRFQITRVNNYHIHGMLFIDVKRSLFEVTRASIGRDISTDQYNCLVDVRDFCRDI